MEDGHKSSDHQAPNFRAQLRHIDPSLIIVLEESHKYLIDNWARLILDFPIKIYSKSVISRTRFSRSGATIQYHLKLQVNIPGPDVNIPQGVPNASRPVFFISSSRPAGGLEDHGDP